MNKIILLIITSGILFSCSNQSTINTQIQEKSSINSNKSISKNEINNKEIKNNPDYIDNEDNVISINDKKVAIINKDSAIKYFKNDQILLLRTNYLDSLTDLYEIRFKKGNIGSVDGIIEGLVVMILKKTGESELTLNSNTNSIKRTKLSFEETKSLLRGAKNYKSNIDKLGKLFGN
ncbi:MAG: hypothetical protein U0354_00685 [Candidatus Sericytochromatia bacterium]